MGENKRRAVETLLRDDEWSAKSDRWIADTCGVSADLVGDIRKVSFVDTCVSVLTHTRRDKTGSCTR